MHGYSLRPVAGRALVGIVMALSLASCGGDDDPTGPVSFDIVGNWAFEESGVADDGHACEVKNTTLTIVRNGNTLEGTATFGGAGSIVCSDGTGSFNGSSPLNEVVQNGANVEFSYTSTSGTTTATGTAGSDGNSMSGTVSFFLTSGSVPAEYTGTWSATRQ